jgi:WD40 repeat protein
MRSIAAVLATATVMVACSEKHVSAPAEPVVEPPLATTGTIEISVSTTGPEQDADGYTLSITFSASHSFARITGTGTHTVTGAQPGDVRVLLYGLATNCRLTGANPLDLTVKAGVTSAVSFAVSCVASGSLRVTSVTTGPDPDSDGYVMLEGSRGGPGHDAAHSFTGGLDLPLPSNGTTTASSLIPGTYTIFIQSVAPNCSVPAAVSLPIVIVAGAETSLTLEFNCVPVTRIAFVAGAGEFEWEAENIAKTDIYVANSNGTGVVRLTSTPGADLNPAWSPDGRKIVFASERDGNREIYVMNADGTDPVRLTSNSAWDSSPVYSPDGKRIAFVSERDGNPDIYTMDVNGANVARLTSDPLADIDPAFAPDGSRIAFVRSGVGIYLVNPDGAAETRLTSWGSDTQPAWSPDSRTIAFVRGEREIWLTNTQGANLVRFYYWNYSRANPDWSPDGRRIAFDDRDCWDNGPCPRGIIIATIEGHFSIQIRNASEPAWKPR